MRLREDRSSGRYRSPLWGAPWRGDLRSSAFAREDRAVRQAGTFPLEWQAGGESKHSSPNCLTHRSLDPARRARCRSFLLREYFDPSYCPSFASIIRECLFKTGGIRRDVLPRVGRSARCTIDLFARNTADFANSGGFRRNYDWANMFSCAPCSLMYSSHHPCSPRWKRAF
jgi:hypothetical protein